MIGNGNIFSGGKKSSRNKLNRLRSDTTAAGNMRGDNLIHVMSNNNGYSFTFDVQKLISLLPLRIGGSIRLAYCKAAAGSGATIQCYLDTDWNGQGTEPTPITVYCKIYEGGTALNTCAPLLADGDLMFVFNDGTCWRSLTTFIPTDTCG